MGRVFLGLSPGFRLVAVKVIRPEHAGDPGFRERFRHEVDVARRVSGMFTPPVLDADPDGTPPWLATTYVPAPSLTEVVRGNEVMDLDALRALGAGLAEALATIHRAGVVHRDLKPGNVLVAADGPRVIDFGIAKAFDAHTPAATGSVIGTPGYLAPEQLVLGGELGPATDVFALGCVLTFAATGVNPFGAGEYEQVLQRTQHADPSLDGVPDELRPLVASCLAKAAERRPPVGTLLRELTPADPDKLLTPRVRAQLAHRAQEASSLARQAPGTAPPGRAGLGRRGFLTVAASAGAVLGIAAAAGAHVLSEQGDARLSSASGPARPAAPGPTAGPAPVPLWRRPITPLPIPEQAGSLARLGSTLVVWNTESARGLDAATGSPRWTRAVDTAADPASNWAGVFGRTLLGFSATTGVLSPADPRLVGVTGTGATTKGTPLTAVLGAAGADPTFASLSCLGTGGGVVVVVVVDVSTALQSKLPPGTVVAVDQASGHVLWHRTVPWGSLTVPGRAAGGGIGWGGVVDDRRCYLQGGASTLALDLRSGKVMWTAQHTSLFQLPPLMIIDGGTLLIAGATLLALDTASGAQRWSNSGVGTLGGLAVAGGRVYQVGTQEDVSALDGTTGKTLWHTANPVPDTAGSLTVTASGPPSATTSLLAIPLGGETSGVLVLSAADGTPRWAYRDPIATAVGWSVLATADIVYGLSASALYAFPAPTR
jgi:outer membrane protein assembly factor BamB